MTLPPHRVRQFYSIWQPLLGFVNQRLRLVPSLLEKPWSDENPVTPGVILPLRDALWANDPLREAFVAENPAGLSTETLAIVASWQYREAGPFIVLRHLAKHSLFLQEKTQEIYAVGGLQSPLDQVVPFLPCYVKTFLLPFQDCIIYDSLMSFYNIHFGPGMRRDWDRIYKDARERGAIITSLLPSAAPSPEEAGEAAQTTNAKVLQVFRTHLFRANLSEKVVDRDLAYVTAFAETWLLTRTPPGSLRDFSAHDIEEYFDHVQESPRKDRDKKETRTSLKRFLRFLRATERMDYWAATGALEYLEGRAERF
jgi:hypothetical protein